MPDIDPVRDIEQSPLSSWTDADLSVRLRRGAGGAVRVEGTLCRAPLWFRWDGATLWLVGSGASPVDEDHIRVRIDVGPGVHVALRSVAATVVYAARRGGTRWDTEIHVADGASLDWRPDPVILTERACHAARTSIDAGGDAEVVLDEVIVLGRVGESPGELRSSLDVRVETERVLLTSFDTSLPGWSGPAGVDGATVIANRLRLGRPERMAANRTPMRPAPDHVAADTALLEPAPGCRLAVVTSRGAAAARRALDAVLPC